MDNLSTHIALLAQALPLNETAYSDCPSCGGRSKLSVTRTREGVLWNCFKDSCNVRGRDIVQGELLPPKRKQSKLRPYQKPLYPLSEFDLEYFLRRFHVATANAVEHVQVTADERYALHVKDIRGYTRGYTIRNGWTGEPETPRTSQWDGPKTVVYMHSVGATMSWHHALDPSHSSVLVLVEDQMSAMRAAEEGVSAVALLGTSLDNDKVREIAMWKPSQVIIALDADATQTAFKLARKWGLAFPKTRVAVLERDLKDEEDGDVPYVLGL